MLVSLFPAQAATLGAAYAEALAAVPDGRAKTGGIGAEVVEARIWGGVHYREADVQGVRIGDGVARYVLAHEFRRR